MPGDGDGLIMFVEDDRATRESIALALELEGYKVLSLPDGSQGLERASSEPIDLLIVDLGLPYVDGLTLCRKVRAIKARTPILILTARTEVADRVAGLDAGADDYLAKPFALEELLARVRALLRRSRVGASNDTIDVGELHLEESARAVRYLDEELELTKTEFDLLALLARNAGFVLSPARIYDEIWGYDFGQDSKNLAVYVGYLRRKLEAADRPRVIHTVRGVGYVLRA